MNKLFAIFLFIVIVGVGCMFAKEPVASITLSNPPVEKHISFLIVTDNSKEAYTEFATINGVACLYIPGKKYGYFNVNDATITANDHDLIFTITYFDEGYGTVALQYNAIGEENSDKYRRQSFNKTGSNTWTTTTISISDASLRNLQNNKSDFRISSDVSISKIEIFKGSLNPLEEEIPVTTGSAYSEFKGKSVAGYQAWFTANDENFGWVHWSGTTRPAPGNSSFEVYPDVREYAPEALSQTGFANLGNGAPSKVFTSAEVIDVHFMCMKTPAKWRRCCNGTNCRPKKRYPSLGWDV